MYHRDYFIRMIQQFMVLLARLAGLKAKTDPEVILMETENGLRHFTGLPPELIKSLTAASLASILNARQEGDYTTLAMTALLLKAEGEARVSIKDPGGVACLQKSIDLLGYLEVDRLPIELRSSMNFKEEVEQLLQKPW
ncbi:MAG TPA: hypothetical protein PKN93_14730 [Leptospiraceae bacterium]|nr:hypothetical protein [Leptospiraceae bacterium]